MPIPVRYILTARLLGVYLMGLMYSGTVLLPAILVYWILCPLSATSIVGGLMLLVLVTTKTVTGGKYLYPVIPFNARALGRLLYRQSISRFNAG